MELTIAFVLFSSRRRLSVSSLASATATGLVVLIVMYGFVMVRADQNPPVNWGGATTISRLWELVNRADFTTHGSSARASSAASSAGNGPSSASSQAPIRSHSDATATITLPAAVANDVRDYAVIFGRELGGLAVLLAVFGLLASLTWRRSAASYPLLIAFLVNLAAAKAAVDFGAPPADSTPTWSTRASSSGVTSRSRVGFRSAPPSWSRSPAGLRSRGVSPAASGDRSRRLLASDSSGRWLRSPSEPRS